MTLRYGLGDSVSISTYFGSVGEIGVNTTTNTIHIFDSVTEGGITLAKSSDISASSGATWEIVNSGISTLSNVGIGTTNSSSSLTVQGDVSVSGTSTFTGTIDSGSIFSVNDVSSIPIIDAYADRTVELTPYGGHTKLGGAIETVSAATTYMSDSSMVLEMDVRKATVYTYTIPTAANIGIVSFKNMPADTGTASGTTITLLVTQNATGTGNTTAETGIGTNCTVIGYENGSAVTGISTRALVGSASTTTLSTTASDVDFISFFVNYNGGSNTISSNYKVYVTKNGNFRRGNIGI
jgi:hypothetical protein